MQNLQSIFKAVEIYPHSVKARFDITGPQLWALWELGRSSPLSLKDLAARMHLTSSTVVGVVDRLILKDLVIREQDSADRRRVCLSLSPKGQALFAETPDSAQGQLIHGLQKMGPKQLKDLNQELEFLVDVMGADTANARCFSGRSDEI